MCRSNTQKVCIRVNIHSGQGRSVAMGVKFAGSRSIDERRRRRLVGENGPALNESSQVAPSAGFWKIRPIQSDSEIAPVSPLQSLIPLSRLKICLLCGAVPLVGLLLVLLSQTESLIADQKIRTAIELPQSHLWRFLSGILFLASAGFCWLISWFRSASETDYEGCYKSWYFSGWIFLFFGIVAGCDAHVAFSQVLGDSVRIKGAFLQTLFWAVPMSAFLIEPMRCFAREMWQCRRSFLMMSLSCLASITFLEMKLPRLGSEPLLATNTSQVIILASSILVPSLILSALLSQVHYVMYVSSDPVARRKSWVFFAISWGKKKVFRGVKIAGVYCLAKTRTVFSFLQRRVASRVEKMKNNRAKKKAAQLEVAEIVKAEAKKESPGATCSQGNKTSETEVIEKKPRRVNPVGKSSFKQIPADEQKKVSPPSPAEASEESNTQQAMNEPHIQLSSKKARRAKRKKARDGQ